MVKILPKLNKLLLFFFFPLLLFIFTGSKFTTPIYAVQACIVDSNCDGCNNCSLFFCQAQQCDNGPAYCSGEGNKQRCFDVICGKSHDCPAGVYGTDCEPITVGFCGVECINDTDCPSGKICSNYSCVSAPTVTPTPTSAPAPTSGPPTPTSAPGVPTPTTAVCSETWGACGSCSTCPTGPSSECVLHTKTDCTTECLWDPTTCRVVPTPAPLPAPVLSGSCSASGTTLTFKWDPISGATAYAVRIDDQSSAPWDGTEKAGDTINNNAPCNAGTDGKCTYQRATSTGPGYEAWVHSINSAGVSSADSNHVTITCQVPAGTISGSVKKTDGTAYLGGGTVCLDPNAAPGPYCTGKISTSVSSSDGSYQFSSTQLEGARANHNVFLDPTNLTTGYSVTSTNPVLATYNSQTGQFSPLPINFTVKPPDVCGELNADYTQSCTDTTTKRIPKVYWTTVSGGQTYQLVLRDSAGAAVGLKDYRPEAGIPACSPQEFSNPFDPLTYPSANTYTGWVYAKDSSGATIKQDSESLVALNCTLPATPVPPIPTPATECTPNPYLYCSTSVPPGCVSVPSLYDFCQTVNPGSRCWRCPTPTPLPPSLGCSKEEGILGQSPTVDDNCQAYGNEPACKDANGYVRNIRIKVTDSYFSGGEEEGRIAPRESILAKVIQKIGSLLAKTILAATSQAGYFGEFYRTDTFGFIDSTSIRKTFLGENPHGSGVFFQSSLPDEGTTYFQAQSYNTSGPKSGATSGIWLREDVESRDSSCPIFSSSWSVDSLTVGSITPVSVTLSWRLETNFKAAGSQPPYYAIRKNGAVGYVSSNQTTATSAQKVRPSCDSFCDWERTVSYTLTNLTPSIRYEFRVGAYSTDRCTNTGGASTVLATTSSGSGPSPAPGAPSRISVDWNRSDRFTSYIFTPPASPNDKEEGTRLYKSSGRGGRWQRDDEVRTEYYRNSAPGPMGRGAYFWAQESIDDLEPGTYYYGLDAYSDDCRPHIQSNQTVYTVQGFKIQGKVFFDENTNGVYNPAPGPDTCYSGAVRLTVDDTLRGTSKSYDVEVDNCDYSLALKAGTYKVSFAPPFGFRLTNTADTPFTTSLPPDSPNRNFGIFAPPWFQTKEGDVRAAGKLISEVPSTALVSKVVSLDGAAGSPGILFYGGSEAKLGSGAPSSKNWLARETFISSTDLSYESFERRALSSGETMKSFRCGVNGCLGPPSDHGVYKYVQEEGRETMLISQPWVISGGKRAVILVPGDLKIQGSLTANDPAVTNKKIITINNTSQDNNNFLAFIVKGNIIVDPSIGQSNPAQTASNLEGWFIADGTFIPGSFPTAGTDNRLNIEGLAMIGPKTTTPLRFNRHLGSVPNSKYPSVYVSYRLDLALNVHPALLRPFFHWEEIAP